MKMLVSLEFIDILSLKKWNILCYSFQQIGSSKKNRKFEATNMDSSLDNIKKINWSNDSTIARIIDSPDSSGKLQIFRH